ncbi:MAG TPA: glycosyltransferase family 1 protein, partial [Armatimonadota bacterium]|nr:glycosyltransferase family 1 protein [Armatimonadota bacterium]
RRAVKKADAIIAISESTKRDIVELLGAPEHKIYTTLLGVDPPYRPVSDERKERVAREHGLGHSTILYLGTLEPRKNIPALLAAFSQARKSSPAKDCTLVLAGGKGWFFNQTFKLVEDLGLKESVRFTGYVPAEDLPALYSAATVFVYPSLHEGFGLPPLEAMACGTPVITSNASSLPEVVGDAGIMVDPYNVEELAGAILRVLCDPDLRQEMSAKGLERAKKFSWEETARQTLKVYERVHNETRG